MIVAISTSECVTGWALFCGLIPWQVKCLIGDLVSVVSWPLSDYNCGRLFVDSISKSVQMMFIPRTGVKYVYIEIGLLQCCYLFILMRHWWKQYSKACCLGCSIFHSITCHWSNFGREWMTWTPARLRVGWVRRVLGYLVLNRSRHRWHRSLHVVVATW